MTNEELAYIAGFIDGEGYIGIKKYDRNPDKNWVPTYSERVSVAGICEPVIKGFNKIIKGYTYYHKPSKLSKRGYWSWELTEEKARKFLRLIYPYLKVKKDDADLVLKLSENKRKTFSKEVNKQDRDLRESWYLQVKSLHSYQYDK